jgi:hypothetical protein
MRNYQINLLLTVSIHQVESNHYTQECEAEQIPNFLVLAKPAQPIYIIHSSIKLDANMHKISTE